MNALSVPPGPLVGKILIDLFTRVEAGDLENDKDILLQEIEKWRVGKVS